MKNLMQILLYLIDTEMFKNLLILTLIFCSCLSERSSLSLNKGERVTLNSKNGYTEELELKVEDEVWDKIG